MRILNPYYYDSLNNFKPLMKLNIIILLIVLFSEFLLLNSCGSTTDLVMKRRLDGYVTFSRVQFIMDDEKVNILLTYIGHGGNEFNSIQVTSGITDELKQVAHNCDMQLPTTTFLDSIGHTTIIAENYLQVETFFKNLIFRFNEISKKSINKFKQPVINVNFSHDSLNNRAKMIFSRFLFEPYALISFKTTRGFQKFTPKTNIPILSVHTSTDKYIEFLVQPIQKSSTKKQEEIIIINTYFKKPPLHWYSWETISDFFVDEAPRQKTKSLTNNSMSWSWVNSKLEWIAATLIPILTFLGFKIGKRRN